jgi:hypothetical protein
MRTSIQVYPSGRHVSGTAAIGLNRPAPIHHQQGFFKKKKASNIAIFHRRTLAILPPSRHACNHRELLHRATRIRPPWEPPSRGPLVTAFFGVVALHPAPSHSTPRPVPLTLLLSPAPICSCSCFTVVAPAPAPHYFATALRACLATPAIAPLPIPLLMLCL